MTSLYFITLIIIYLIVIVTLAFVPYFTRRTECFGIAVPEGEHLNPVLKSYRRLYAAANLLIGLILLGGAIAWNAVSPGTFYFAVYIVFIQIIAGFLIYLRFHGLVRRYKERSEWKDDVSSTISVDMSSGAKEYISAGWLLLFPAVIIITVVLGIVYYNKIPALVPMHYDAAGQVDRYAHKSYSVIFFSPVMQLFLSGLFTFIFYMVRSRRRRIDPEHEEESRRRGNIFRRAMGIFAVVGGVAMLLSFACIQLSIIGFIGETASVVVTLAATVVVCLFAVLIGARVGQGGSRLRNGAKGGKPSPGRLSIKDDDSLWKLGMFYFNPDDPAIFVEKRFGVGYTINLGRPVTYIVIVGFIAVIVLISVASALLTK